MQKQNDLALNLMNLYDPKSYTKFDKGYFTNQPNMTGYFYIFKDITDPKFCLVLNDSDVFYKSNFAKIKDYIFIVQNISSLEEYLQELPTKYLLSILEVISQNLNRKNTRNLPYGYYFDENGDLKIDIKKANEVKKIYDRYIDTESVRQIADERKTNFSHIRDILHDNEEYMQMQQKILPITILKQVNELLAKNVKGRFKKRTFKDKLKEIQQRKKRIGM